MTKEIYKRKEFSSTHRKNLSLAHIGKHHSLETRLKMSESEQGEKHWNWKGENLGYGGIHYRIKRLWGQADHCEKCGVLGSLKYEWANKNHKYSLDKTDWMQLCTSCHRKYDYEMVKGIKQCA